MLRTLVLLRMRCGVFDTEVDEDVGGEDKVWTFKTVTINHRLKVISRAEINQLCRFQGLKTFLIIFLP